MVEKPVLSSFFFFKMDKSHILLHFFHKMFYLFLKSDILNFRSLNYNFHVIENFIFIYFIIYEL